MFLYLDSSDYSNLADREKKGDEWIKIYEKLMLLKKKGYHFPKTMVHIFEMMQLDNLNTKEAVKRAAMLEELSGGDAFIDVYSILKMEFSNGNVSINDVYNSDGLWLYFDREQDLDLGIRDRVLNAAKERGINRSERRKLGKQKLTKKGINRELAKSLYGRKPYSASVRVAGQDVEIKVEPEIMVDLACGNLSKLSFAKKVLPPLMDARLMYGPYRNNIDEVQNMQNIMRKQGQKLKEYYEKLLLASTKLVNTILIDVNDRMHLKKNLLENVDVDVFIAKFHNAEVSLVKDKIEQGCLRNNVQFFNLIKRLTITRALYSAYAEIETGAGPAKARSSDFADCLHAIYLPYVDYFRSDSGFSEILSQEIGKNRQTVILLRAEELLNLS